MKKLLILAIIMILLLLMCGGCASQKYCPAYQDNYQATEHRFNRWNGNKVDADFCKPPKPRKSKF